MAGKTQTFESALNRLEEIVKRLENGEVTLEESMKLFEEGTKLVKQCSAQLDKAEQKITLLTTDDNGTVTEKEIRDEDLGKGTS